VDRVEAGSRLVGEAGSTIGDVVANAQRVADIIGEITAASGEQSSGIGQINAAVNQLDQMTQQNAALVEESAAAAESLKDQAVRLSQVIAMFRTGGSSPTHPVAAPRAGVPKAPLSTVRPAAQKTAPPVLAARPPARALQRPPDLQTVASQPGKAAVAAGHEGDWESF
jgi:methyl-accepting chemotaxis protein